MRVRLLQRITYFDVTTMALALGPWRVSIPLKKDARPLEQREQK